ncbi:MAG: hypothetical protein EBZ83_02770 [Verrucomicrobia bacterium]|nr:hypothetical protein [Verrucomicrobiota bacterium]NBU68833.1 hypothetical protein [Verrucomicrobiota bacterium]NDC00328.1 hypothetical protein [Verrucomicrobiota bacterium]
MKSVNKYFCLFQECSLRSGGLFSVEEELSGGNSQHEYRVDAEIWLGDGLTQPSEVYKRRYGPP